MHFKNGREAKDGDSVIMQDWAGRTISGRITDLNPNISAGTCNCTLVIPTLGGTTSLTCMDVGTMYHAEDAYAAIDAQQQAAAQAAADAAAAQAAQDAASTAGTTSAS